MHLLLCPSGSGQQPLTQPRELEPHGTGTHLTPPSPTLVPGATQPGQVSGSLMVPSYKVFGQGQVGLLIVTAP